VTNRDHVFRDALQLHSIPGLDAMRAVAVTMVVLFHQGLPVSGSLGVMIFFVLSGFLITGMLLREHSRSGTISLRQFYRRRAYRIFPTFYVCWAVTIGLLVLQHRPFHWAQAAASFFYLSDYARAFLPAAQQVTFPMGISWSLAIEEQFYLLWPLMLLLVLSRKGRGTTWVGMGIIAIWCWRALLLSVLHGSWDYAYNAFDTRADALLIGGWLAFALRERRIPWAIPLLVRSQWLVLPSVAALVVASYMDIHGSARLWPQLLIFTLEPVLAAIVLVQWVFWGSIGWRFLEFGGVKWIARLSYAIYLYHPIVLGVQRYIHVPHGQRLLAIPLILTVACASYYCIERPFMRKRDHGRNKSVLMDDGLHRAQSN